MWSLYGYVTVFLLIGITECGQWKYKGPTGPQSWHELFPSACSGTAQSPIDIKPERTMYDPNLKDFSIFYDPPKPGSRMKVKNNGHAIQIDTEGEFYVTNGGLHSIYKVAQFHFHWGSEDHMGSEHLLDSIAYPIEMHMVTYNSDEYGDIAEAATEKGGLAVLGVLFEIHEQPNPKYETIIKALEHVKDPGLGNEHEIEALSLRDLLPADISKYYRYNGSLTTPGCFETVTWTVFHQKQTISFGQLMKFRRVLQHRHKHHKHRKNHKRSTRVRRQQEGAEAVLEEIGIQRDPVQKGELLSTLITQQNAEAQELKNKMHHHPHDVAHNVTETPTTAYANEKSPTLVDNVQPEGHIMVTEDQTEWIQDNLVNNFRPIQPLNNRMVYRSFKLRDVYVRQSSYHVQKKDEPQPEAPIIRQDAAVATVYSKQNNNKNSAKSICVSIASLICVFIIALL